MTEAQSVNMWTDLTMEQEQNTTFWMLGNGTSNLTDASTTEDPYAESPELYYFRRIVPGIFLLIGIPGNCLSIMVMCRKFFRSTSSGVYLLSLLIADVVYMFSNYSFIFWLINNFKIFELVHNGISCKLWVYLMETSGYISSWVLAAMTFERMIVIRSPHRRNAICTRKRARIIIAVISFVMITLNIYILVTFDSVQGNNTNPIRPTRNCYFAKPYSSYKWLVIAYNLTPFLMYGMLPGICILICNIIMIYTLARRPKLAAVKSASSLARDAEYKKVTMLLMAACGFFLVSTVPVTLLVFLEQVLNKLMQLGLETLNTVYLYVMVLLPLNQTFNFMVYCIAGESFRKELKNMFRACCKKCLSTKKKRVPTVRGEFWAKVNHQWSFDKGSSYYTRSISTASTENTFL